VEDISGIRAHPLSISSASKRGSNFFINTDPLHKDVYIIKSMGKNVNFNMVAGIVKK
jgi:hypothetical protein